MSKNNPQNNSIRVTPGDESRLDLFLANRFTKWSRMYFKRLISNGGVLVDDQSTSPHYKLRPGQTVKINWPIHKMPAQSISSKDYPFDIVFEDDSFMAINKPAGLLVHPAGHTRKGDTLSEILFPRVEKADWPDEVRPGLIHRLDRDTSGIIIFAKTQSAHHLITKQFANRTVKKNYVALAKGIPKAKEGTLEGKIARHPHKRQRFAITGDGRASVTKFKIKNEFSGMACLMDLSPLTGRTHQIRVQLSTFGFPILGDKVYGGSQADFKFVKRQMLHAANITFKHPETEKKVYFEAPLPPDFQDAIKKLRSMD